MNESERRRAIGAALGRMDAAACAPAIPSGIPELDWALGIGGFPRGRITEIFGPESCGKTTIGLLTAAQIQNAGGAAAYVDADFALDADRARALGVDLDKLLMVEPRSGEEALEIAGTLTASRTIDLLVVDSVAALAPRLELDAGLDAPLGALHSQLMTRALRRLSSAALRTGACLLFLNQMRARPGLPAGECETTAGGPAVRLRAAVRLELRPIGPRPGARIQARVLKNKLAPPFRTAEFALPHTASPV